MKISHKTQTAVTTVSLALLILSTHSQANERTNRFGVGLYADNGLSRYQGHTGDDELKLEGSIAFQYRGERLNIDEQSTSYKFFDTGKYHIEVIGNHEKRGYEAGNSSSLTGMNERKASFDLGGRIAAKTPVGTVSLAATTDVSNKHKGQEVDLKLSQDLFRKGPKGNPRRVSVDLQAGLKWQSDDVVDYYYGVKPNEATSTRTTYTGPSALIPYVGATARANLSEHITFDLGAVYKHYPDEITQSPIVDRDHDIELKAGLTYWF